jgi:hypothetical protein
MSLINFCYGTVYRANPGEQDFKQDSSVFFVQTSYPVGEEWAQMIIEGKVDG